MGTGSGSGTGVGVADELGLGDGVGDGVGVAVGDAGGSWPDKTCGPSCLPIAVERSGRPIKASRNSTATRIPIFLFILFLHLARSFGIRII